VGLKITSFAIERNREFRLLRIINLIDTTSDYCADLNKIFYPSITTVKIALFYLGIKAIIKLA